MLRVVQYSFVIVSLLIANLFFFDVIDRRVAKTIEYEEQLLINQARAHFKDQVNTRSWNARYGGVYVYPKAGQKPNPYLIDNTIRDELNQTLIKINPAWMTRQLSELESMNSYHFRITSLNPLNPHNKPSLFEKKALTVILENNQSEYYEFNAHKKRFEYMGALITQKPCLQCHQHQGYKVGDLRGGISVTLESPEHFTSRQEILSRQGLQKLMVVVVTLIFGALIIRILHTAQLLEERVKERTQEINQTKHLLQAVLDAELSFVVVTNEHNMIYVNQTLLNFFDYDSLEEFESNKVQISRRFSYIDENDTFQNGEHNDNWIEYILSHPNRSSMTIEIEKEEQKYFFRPHAKNILLDNQNLFLIILSEITKDFNEQCALKKIASTDALTGLANRSKFNQVIEQQIELAQSTANPLSLLFVDIDFFKEVNDTYGHNVGDEVLKALAKILKNSVRSNDFVVRWGGEEFVIILPSTTAQNAIKVANKIRNEVKTYTFDHGQSLTISCGVTQYQARETVGNFIQRADQALYQAKENGRNRVEAL